MIMSDYIKYHNEFDYIPGDDRSKVFEIFPKVFKDSRGSFAEVLKVQHELNDPIPDWFMNQSWIMQINRSVSKGGTVRGCHAQKGAYCQGKLVEAINAKLYDIIIDARPDSKTFGNWGVFVLDPDRQNKLWVPRGFLHSFATPLTDEDFIFQYFCDNEYSHENEFGVSPLSVLPKIAKELWSKIAGIPGMKDLVELFDNTDKLSLSDKDLKNQSLDDFLAASKKEFEETGKVWYRE